MTAAMSEMGAVSKRFCRKGEDGRELAFSGFDYARIAAISGWMPMIFITRVRL